ncbi:hypothetical protein CLV48_103261 [Cecembia rubra]|uniref:Uncharacterized protein n=1 Tax=Cecembia rubra TaxID=1485585 RepID=A0A2P8E8D3_9BACT|nr:hypothetical protein CLV48_103261 [Cecembia rubra]
MNCLKNTQLFFMVMIIFLQSGIFGQVMDIGDTIINPTIVILIAAQSGIIHGFT